MVATRILSTKTYEDYLNTPDDGQRYELIDGEIFVSPSPQLLHQLASIELSSMLHRYVRGSRLGRVVAAPMDVRLATNEVVQPDLMFIRTGSPADNPNEDRVEGAPDLLVEILSPSNRGYDLVRKRQLYARCGVPEYWIVDPINRTIETLSLNGDEYETVPHARGLMVSMVLPSLRFNISAFFTRVASGR
jgi:Uma2 family endonuclease